MRTFCRLEERGRALSSSTSLAAVSYKLKTSVLRLYVADPILVGNDIRKAVMDGYPVDNALASDIEKRKSINMEITSKYEPILFLFNSVLGIGTQTLQNNPRILPSPICSRQRV